MAVLSESSPVTMTEVAARANTSIATVSRVLANHSNVSDRLRRRVLKAIEETGYTRNAAASALRRGGTGAAATTATQITLVSCGQGLGRLLDTWSEALGTLLEVADELGIMVNTVQLRANETGKLELPADLGTAPTDGWIVLPRHGSEHADLAKLKPAVMVGSTPARNLAMPVVEPDFRQGMEALFEHLCGLGHRRFEYVLQQTHIHAHRERAELFLGLAHSSGVEGRVATVASGTVAEYAQSLADRPPAIRPTALLGASDGTANELIQCLVLAGIRVPDEISVAGFDGFNWARTGMPRLTSWYVDWQALGRLALHTLAALIGGQDAPTRVLAGGTLHAGETTAAPARAAEFRDV